MRGRLPVIWIGLSCFLGIFASGAEAQQRRYAGPPYFRAFQDYKRNGAFVRVVLRNGLTILIEEHASFPLASITTCVQNDSRDPERLAASELLSRLYRRSLELSGEAYKLGGAFSFSNRPGDSCYNLTLPDSSVLDGLQTQVRLLHRPKIEAADARGALQEWKNQSRAARAGRRQDAEAMLRESEALQAFVPRPRPEALSEKDDLPALLASVHQAGHRPERTVLVISGSVFEERLLKKIVELYAPLPGSGTPVRVSAGSIPNLPQGLSWKQVRQGEGGYLVLAAFPIVGRRHKDHLALELVPYLLAAGRSSMLGRYGITPEGGMLDADARTESDEGSGLLSMAVYADPAHLDTAEVEALAQLDVLSRREPGALELARAKSLWLRAYYEGLQSLEQRSRLLALHELAGSYLDRDKLAAKIDEVSPADIRRVVNEYLKTSRLSVLEYAPQQAEQRSFTGRSFDDTMQALVRPAAEKQIGEMNALAPPEGETAAKAVSFEFKPTFTRTDLERTSVLRGPEIYLQERHDVPLVHFGFFFPGGRRDEKGSAAGITELLAACMLRGGGDGAELPWQSLESTGAVMQVVNEPDFFGFQATVLAPRREAFLGMVVEWLHQATFSEETIAFERRRLLSRLERQRAEPQSDLSWARRQLFAGDPFGESRYGSPESLASLAMESLTAWKKSHVDGLHPWILVRGDFDGTSFVQPFISKLSKGSLKTVRMGQNAQAADDVYLEEDEEQSSHPGGDMVSSARDGFVLAGFPGPQRGSRDDWVLEAVENLLEGMGGRLERLLQEDPAPDATRWRMVHEAALNRGAIFVMGHTDPSIEQQVLERLTGQLARLKGAVIRPTDWNNALVLTITEFYRRQQAGGPFTLEMARNIVAGAGVRFEHSYLNAIRQARPNDLQLLAGTYLAGGEESEE